MHFDSSTDCLLFWLFVFGGEVQSVYLLIRFLSPWSGYPFMPLPPIILPPFPPMPPMPPFMPPPPPPFPFFPCPPCFQTSQSMSYIINKCTKRTHFSTSGDGEESHEQRQQEVQLHRLSARVDWESFGARRTGDL